MKITVKNDHKSPVYITFEGDAELNINPGSSATIDVEEGSRLIIKDNHVDTSGVDRPSSFR